MAIPIAVEVHNAPDTVKVVACPAAVGEGRKPFDYTDRPICLR